jgi:Lon protease-like protein
MSRLPFDPAFEELPGSLPIFPLPGVLLLPGGRLPLNVFEPRYLAMVGDVLKSHRLIGMVQPTGEGEGDVGRAEVYGTGCAGRITAFQETEDRRYLITLTGLIRFDVRDELPALRGYRVVQADWGRYAGDLAEADPPGIDRPRILDALRAYFEATGISGDWDAIDETPNEKLITSIAMICPFDASEKQALLEAPGLEQRAEAITAILEMAALRGTPSPDGGETARH